MTYYPDLSTYEYHPYAIYRLRGQGDYIHIGIANMLNVGWLEGAHPFPTGTTSDEFHEKLLTFCFYNNAFTPMRGTHTCDLPACPIQPHPQYRIKTYEPINRGDQTAFFGGSEIRVPAGGIVYAAPSLIYHYVVAHQYLPPDEFVQAVMQSVEPGSDEWYQQIETICGPVLANKKSE